MIGNGTAGRAAADEQSLLRDVDLVDSRDLPRPHAGGPLKLWLKTLDLMSLAMGWSFAVTVMAGTKEAGPLDAMMLAGLAGIGIAVNLMAMASKRLWLSRACAVRSAELEGLGESAIISALAVLVAGDLLARSGPAKFGMLGAFVSFVLMVTLRGFFARWLRRARRKGRFVRPLVLVGANHQAFDLARLINEHPGAGYRVVGVCGPRADLHRMSIDVALPWLGDYADASSAVEHAGATGALVVSSALKPGQLSRTVRHLIRTGTHVHLSSGVRGISHERLLPLPVAREPLFYLERTSLTRSQLNIKRVLDVVVGGTMLLLMLPALLLAALAVKVTDWGPVLFKQERVGHLGRHFTLYKLRTMVPNAEALRADLIADNARDGGPLFKLQRDPRVTRVGRLLRATSLDELPQLLNVLKGDMSLVGPRPALPSEVAQFDDELMERGRMMPGITGLWQVEARDDPSFRSYRRLDLFYVDNWSIGLDIAILAATFGAVLSRGVRLMLLRQQEEPDPV